MLCRKSPNIFFLIISIIILLFSSGVNTKAVIDLELEQQLIQLKPQDKVRIIIVMEDQKQQFYAPQETVINSLQAQAQKTQGEIIDFLQSKKVNNQVDVYRSFWIVNAIFAEVEAQLIPQISKLPQIAQIKAEYMFKAIEQEIVEQSEIGSWPHVESTFAYQAWESGIRGQNVTVAVADTGVDITHQALADAMGGMPPYHEGYWAEFDGNGEMVLGSMPRDTHDHGTHVSGTVLGRNIDYEVGVAPEATLAHALVIPHGSGTFAQIMAGLEWVTEQGFDIFNGSFGTPGIVEELAIATDNMLASGVLPVFALGNNSISAPGNTPSAIGVGAFDNAGQTAPFHVGGVIEYPGYQPKIKPDISAPGVDIWSTIPGGFYRSANGTSMAAPHVAGAAALLLSAAEMDVYELRDLLYQSVGGHQEQWGWSHSPEKNTDFGYGRLNVSKGLALLPPPGPQGEIKGYIKDETKPIADARLYFDGPASYVVTSDENGKYHLELLEGFYDVTIEVFGYLTKEIELLIIANQIKEQDFYLQPAPLGVLEGQVIDSVYQQGLLDVKIELAGVDKTTLTDQNGKFNLTITEGRYNVLMSKDGFATKEIAQVRVFPGQSTKLDQSLDFGFNSLGGIVVDSVTQQKLVEARVEILTTNQEKLTDQTGRFNFDLAAGNYEIKIDKLGYDQITESITIEYGIALDLKIELSKDRGSIAGVIKNQNSDAIKDVKVRIKEFDFETSSDQDGYFHLEQVPSGKWTIEFRHPSYHLQTITVQLEKDQVLNQNIILQKKEQEITKAQLQGFVFAADDNPLSEVLISISELTETIPPQKTDADGFFAFELPPGGYTLVLDKTPNYKLFQKTFYLEPGADLELHLTLAENFPPAKVENFTVLFEGDAVVELGWDHNLETDLSHYLIYRSLNNQDFSLYGETTNNWFRADQFLRNDYTYYFMVKAVDENNLASEPSQIVEGTPRSQAPIIENFNVTPRSVMINQNIEVSATLIAATTESENFVVNFIIYSLEGEQLRRWQFENGEGSQFRRTVQLKDLANNPLSPNIYQARLEATDEEGNTAQSEAINIVISAYLPQSLSFVIDNNPFNPLTESQGFFFTLPERGRVKIEILTLNNRVVASLFAGEKSAGEHQIFWDGRNQYHQPLLAGVYIVRILFHNPRGNVEEIIRHSVLIN